MSLRLQGMHEEHRLEPNGGFKVVLAVITAAHLLALGGFLMLGLHPLKRMDRERMQKGQLVWVNPGLFGGDVSSKTDAAPAASNARRFKSMSAFSSRPAFYAVRGGRSPGFVPVAGMRRDLFMIERADPVSARDEIVSLVSERLPAHYGVDPLSDIQVFAPVYRGEVGIERLN